MRNYLLRIVISSLTFVVGCTFVWAATFGSATNCFVDEPNRFESGRTQRDTKRIERSPKLTAEPVAVIFRGFIVENETTLVEFEVINQTDRPIGYSSYEEKGSLFYQVKFNGKEHYNWWCGTGLQNFELAPADSLRMKLSAVYLFQDDILKDGEFEVGFHLGVKEDEYTQFWSEKFSIPDELKKRIKAEREIIYR